MKVIVAEDELLAAERLIGLMKECDPSTEIAHQVDSVEDLTKSLSNLILLTCSFLIFSWRMAKVLRPLIKYRLMSLLFSQRPMINTPSRLLNIIALTIC